MLVKDDIGYFLSPQSLLTQHMILLEFDKKFLIPTDTFTIPFLILIGPLLSLHLFIRNCSYTSPFIDL